MSDYEGSAGASTANVLPASVQVSIELEPAWFQNWARRKLWSLAETCFLLLGYEPQKLFQQDAHNGFRRVPEDVRCSFSNIYARLKDEYKLESTNPEDRGTGWYGDWTNRPIDWLLVAREARLKIPEALTALVPTAVDESATNEPEHDGVGELQERKRKTQHKYDMWQRRIDKLSEVHRKYSHTQLCKIVAKERLAEGCGAGTIRRNTRVPQKPVATTANT